MKSAHGACLNYDYQRPLALEEPHGHYDLLHNKQIGTVLFWEDATGKNRWHKLDPAQAPAEIREFVTGMSGTRDTYFSVNEFYSWRRTHLLKSLRACFVDVDLGRPATHYDLDQANDLLVANRLPVPNLIIFSGRGLHLYYLHSPTPAAALPVWQAMEKILINALAPLGADKRARDCTRVLRLVGTVNSKVDTEVRGIVMNGLPWQFHALANEILGHRPDKPTKKPTAKVRSIDAAKIRSGEHPRATIYRRWHQVYWDLQRIGDHYHGNIPEGHRNEFLFISSAALSWFAAPESIGDEVADMAQRYCGGLGPVEIARAAQQSITRATKAAGGEKILWGGEERDPRYMFKRTTLWERLGALAEPVKHRLRAIIPDDLAKAHKQERDDARWSDHYTGQGVRVGNEPNCATARMLAAQGCSKRAIARELDVDEKTIRNWLKGAD